MIECLQEGPFSWIHEELWCCHKVRYSNWILWLAVSDVLINSSRFVFSESFEPPSFWTAWSSCTKGALWCWFGGIDSKRTACTLINRLFNFWKLENDFFCWASGTSFQKSQSTNCLPSWSVLPYSLSADLKARWTASGNLIFDNGTGYILKNLIGRRSLEINLTSYRASSDPTKEIKMRLVSKLAKDDDGQGRNEIYWLKIGLILQSHRT